MSFQFTERIPLVSIRYLLRFKFGFQIPELGFDMMFDRMSTKLTRKNVDLSRLYINKYTFTIRDS